ncbi:MAG: hypothetical protein ACI81Q_002069 [Paracoccaceae bacterium]
MASGCTGTKVYLQSHEKGPHRAGLFLIMHKLS